jgi:hypothetical protein|tara:strand:+ start:2910 stop:4412 length:1503 start_codon:yes stop_codon:yes gene_type:complete
MADDNSIKLFGFEIRRSPQAAKDEKKKVSIVPPNDEDGAGYVTASPAGHYGQYVDINGDQAKDNHQLIMKYRGISMHPEVDMAIEDIVNEAIVTGGLDKQIELVLDKVQAPASIKKTMMEEFDNVLNLLNFGEHGHDQFRRWYVDGRLYHHLVVNEQNPKAGIQEVRYIDSIKIRKVKEVKTRRDQATGAKIVDKVDEYFIYQEKPGTQNTGVKITADSISYVTSGILDAARKKVISHLHKAIKPVNQLRMMEDSLVIYRLARAPERRIFYIDVGNLPKGKAEEYMTNIMAKYRNKLVYDADTGNIKDDRKHMSMLEDFWLPRKEGGRGTEISTLPGGENLGQIEDIIYFQKRVYRALNVPVNRLEQESGFNLGRTTEISRDEIKFQKFIDRLRTKFSYLFLGILKKQLMLKNIITEEDWDNWKYDIMIDYAQDNHFSELKDSEILRERLQTLDQMAQYVGEYFSKEYVMKNVLKYSEQDIQDIEGQINSEPEPEPRDDD